MEANKDGATKVGFSEPERYIVGSYFYNEPSEWGWKYGFTLNKEISHDKLCELTDLIENYLNQYL